MQKHYPNCSFYDEYIDRYPKKHVEKWQKPRKKKAILSDDLLLVGVSGFEPEASWTRTKRDTKLRHTPLTMTLYSK